MTNIYAFRRWANNPAGVVELSTSDQLYPYPEYDKRPAQPEEIELYNMGVYTYRNMFMYFNKKSKIYCLAFCVVSNWEGADHIYRRPATVREIVNYNKTGRTAFTVDDMRLSLHNRLVNTLPHVYDEVDKKALESTLSALKTADIISADEVISTDWILSRWEF